MVAILLTPEIKSLLEGTQSEPYVEITSTVSTISHTRLCSALYTQRLVLRKQTKSLKELLQETSIYPTHDDAVFQLIPPTRDPVLEERVVRLRRQLEDKQYAHMVRDVSRVNATNSVQTDNLRMNKLAPQMSLAFNVIITMATCFTAAYYVFRNSTGSKTYGLIAGVIALIIAMIVEIVLLLTKMYSIDDALRKKEKASNKVELPRSQSSTTSTTTG